MRIVLVSPIVGWYELEDLRSFTHLVYCASYVSFSLWNRFHVKDENSITQVPSNVWKFRIMYIQSASEMPITYSQTEIVSHIQKTMKRYASESLHQSAQHYI